MNDWIFRKCDKYKTDTTSLKPDNPDEPNLDLRAQRQCGASEDARDHPISRPTNSVMLRFPGDEHSKVAERELSIKREDNFIPRLPVEVGETGAQSPEGNGLYKKQRTS